jgi:hypothetical protein
VNIRAEFISLPPGKMREHGKVYVKSLRLIEKQTMVGGSFTLTDGTTIKWRYEKGRDRYSCSLPARQKGRENRFAVVYPIIEEMLYGKA